MRKNNLYNIFINTVLIFKETASIVIFFVSLAFFVGLYAFFYGLITIPMPEGVIGFYRMVPPTSFEIFYMFFSAVMSALIMTITVYSIRMKIKSGVKGRSASIVGLLTGIFGTICPACLGINFLAFGNVFTAQLSFLIPYIFWVQVGGIILLSVGFYFVAKNAYDKKCISCSTDDIADNQSIKKEVGDNSTISKQFVLIIFIAIAIFAYQLVGIFGKSSQVGITSSDGSFITNKDGKKIDINNIIEAVTPKAGIKTNVRWGEIVKKMVAEGVLDPVKLENILTKRYKLEMKPEWRAILSGKDSNLEISNDNAVFMMYILWTFSKHNKNQILTDSPFVKYFKNYDIGVGRAGYGDLELLVLTPAQQSIAKKVAENANRPCCNNSTAAPDCSHGYSALGLVELMASQGFSEKEIFETFVQFNSYWFPETYIKDAIYFNVTEGKKWSEVNKELIAGKKYSSLSGSYKVKNYLKKNFGI